MVGSGQGVRERTAASFLRSEARLLGCAIQQPQLNISNGLY